MPVFAVIRQTDPKNAMEAAVQERFPGAHYSLGNGVWLVAGNGTAREISERLGITPDAENGTGIVLETASYYGRANPAVWSWIKESWERRHYG